MSMPAIIFQIALGLTIFLLGLRVMSSGLTGTLGRRLQIFLGKLTTTPLRGIMTGAVATAFVQSSSVVAVTMVALVHSRVISLYQAFGIILGANIGTTVTAQIVSFDLSAFGLPVMFCGLFLLLLAPKIRLACWVVVGFGAVFFGLSYLRMGLSPVLDLPFIGLLLESLADNLFTGILVGIVVTAVIQSSSATTGIVIALAQADAITLTGAIAVSFGSNIGTVVTTLLSSIGMSPEAKATAYADLIFNLLGVLLVVPLFRYFSYLVVLSSCELPRQVANAHTIFNAFTALLAVPFIKPLTKIAASWAGFSSLEE